MCDQAPASFAGGSFGISASYPLGFMKERRGRIVFSPTIVVQCMWAWLPQNFPNLPKDEFFDPPLENLIF